jgi:hypothetical protein
MCDPQELPGLAHFCEHMLFYSSEKYPVEDEYSRCGKQQQLCRRLNTTTVMEWYAGTIVCRTKQQLQLQLGRRAVAASPCAQGSVQAPWLAGPRSSCSGSWHSTSTQRVHPAHSCS